MTAAVFTEAEFDAVCTLLQAAAGLAFDATRRESLALSVGARLAASGCASVAEYLDRLAGPDGGVELQALLDEVTIPETHFFRNPPQVRALRRHVLPQLVQTAAARDGVLRIWSAGCSTGEEAYTMAILVRELVPASSSLNVQILATDVSARALETARAGRYPGRALHMAEPSDVLRWFGEVAPGSGLYDVRPDLRDIVEFRHHNLVTDPVPVDPGAADLILCRNVTIYFRRDTTAALMSRLHGCLRDGGYLFLGHAETLWQLSDDFTLVSLGDAFVYRRLDGLPDRRQVLPDRRSGGERRSVERVYELRSGAERRGSADRRDQVPRRVDRPVPTPAPPLRAADVGAMVPPQRDALDAVRRALSQASYAEAADLADEVISATPLRADAHYLRGLALTNLGEDSDALVSLRKAIYLDPRAGLAQFLLGGALVRLGEGQAAARAYRAAAVALEHNPPDRAPELDGRQPAELIALCRVLAEQAAVTAEPA